MAAWRIFGHDTPQMQRERVAFEALTNAARESSKDLSQLTQPLVDAQKVVTELQTRVKALERLVPVLATLDQQTEAVSKVQRRTETQLTNTSDDAKRLRTEIDALRTALEEALALKRDLAGFLELGGGFKALRMDADKLTNEVRDVTQGFDRLRERQEELRRTGETVATRLNAFEERQQQVQGGVAATESRVAALGQTLKDLTQASADAAQTKRQLTTVKALADAVTQKVATLEQQRDVVERATGQVVHLHDRMREIDGNHEEAKRADEELRGRLAGLRDEVQRTVQRFELENQGLDAVGQRILDLRGGLTDMEGRVRALDESGGKIAEVRTQADSVASQLQGI